MQVRFDHISLSVYQPEVMSEFLQGLLGLTVGPRGNLGFPGVFLYAGDKDVIHIFARATNQADPDDSRQETVAGGYGNNVVHHIAFYSDDYPSLKARIADLGAQYSEAPRGGTQLQQVFVRGPEGLLVEIQTPKPEVP